jgi:hypothetical protein
MNLITSLMALMTLKGYFGAIKSLSVRRGLLVVGDRASHEKSS